MDKNAIKKYAVWARNELIARVTQKAEQYEITEKKTTPAEADSIGGRLLSEAEKKQRAALIEKIKTDGFEQVMEEVAYTWFNRFTALRFMEVNNYLPSHTRVFTNEAGEFKPQILTDAIQLNLEGLNMDKVFELKDSNKTEELYKYLLITQCNALSSVLPRMFQKISHYTELLLPDYLLREGSVIEQMIALIPEGDWTDQVQIIGWLYQYYNSEPKDAVFAALKKNVKISKENIPAATQLFTPDWIAHYMVENSLGRLWLEGHPNDDLKSEWKYYLDEVEQETDVQEQLDKIRKEYAELKPEEIRCIDPCMGSGHILCVLFDVLVCIYENYGYTVQEAAAKIVENNLWGIDIDERATQLSYFTVMMKARQYDRRFFKRKVQPNVYAIEESNGITSAMMLDMGLNLTQEERGEALQQVMRLVEELHDAKERGSIIRVTPCDWDLLQRFAVLGNEDDQFHLDIHGGIEASERLQVLINIGKALSQKYHIVTTNPPYMGSQNMDESISKYIKDNYPLSKNDLCTVFIQRIIEMLEPNGKAGLMTSYTWLFIVSYQKFRQFLYDNISFVSLIQPEYHAFFDSAYVPICTFIIEKTDTERKGQFIRLEQFYGTELQEKKYLEAKENFDCGYVYFASKQDLRIIPGLTVAYWASQAYIDVFKKGTCIGDYAEARKGLVTGDDSKFLRLWHEISSTQFSVFNEGTTKWKPCNKGGIYRKWYGDNEYVVLWGKDGTELSGFKWPDGKQRSSLRNSSYFFREGITYTYITSSTNGFRYYGEGFAFTGAGPGVFPKDNRDLKTLLAYCNSKVFASIVKMIGSATITLESGEVERTPYIAIEENEKMDHIVDECIVLSKRDWDSFETSWDFQNHPFVGLAADNHLSLLADCWNAWEQVCNERFFALKENEEKLNRFFIDTYGLGNELTPEIEDKDVTVRKSDLQREVRSFISYAVGCIFGRYSLDISGLVYAGGDWDTAKYTTFLPDEDAIIPICDDEYFEDDVVGRFVKFVEVIFGKDTLEENLRFLADALGGKGSSREIIRDYFINDFYLDHLKVYQKRPIYWLFDSGKKNGFKCLVYMHRYKPDTIARIRTDYVHEQQSRYRTAISNLENRIVNAGTGERVKLTKKLNEIQAQAEELRVYEEKIHHLADQMINIDLDDGVKVNYAKFQNVLAKLK